MTGSQRSDQNVYLIGRAYGSWHAARGVTAASLCGDVRLSTPRIKAAAARGLGPPAPRVGGTEAAPSPPTVGAGDSAGTAFIPASGAYLVMAGGVVSGVALLVSKLK